MKFAYFTRRLLHSLRQALFQPLFTSVFLFAACMVVRQYYLIRHSRIVSILYVLCTHYLPHTTMPSIHFWIKNQTCTTQVYCLHILFTNTSLLLKKFSTKQNSSHVIFAQYFVVFAILAHKMLCLILNRSSISGWINIKSGKKWGRMDKNGVYYLVQLLNRSLITARGAALERNDFL